MRRLIALDTSIIVILGGGACSIERARDRAETILLDHREAGEIIGIPAPAYAECCHCKDAKGLLVWPLNLPAAQLANRITPMMLQEAKKRGCKRRNAKVDALVLATAEVTGCAVLYTVDDWFADVVEHAGLRVEVRNLPEVKPFQTTLANVPTITLEASKRVPERDEEEREDEDPDEEDDA